MIVGKEHAIGGHHVFRVMRGHRLLVRHDGCHEVSIRWRSRVRIDHGKKVIPFASRIAGPGKQVVTWRRWFLILRMCPKTGEAKD
jgi:hypothetical protein